MPENNKTYKDITDDAWFDIEGAMEYLKISRTTLYSAMKDGRLGYYFVKGTRQRRLKKSDLDKLMVPGDPEDSADE
jgi:excisionase family DNA binding protein